MKFRSANLTSWSSLHWLLTAQARIKSSDRWSTTTDDRASGFTLIELLVALIVGAIITTLVLGFTVSLMRNNQRESSRSNTQREVQAAIDYINRDVREAVYVYDGECLRTAGVKTSAVAPTSQTPANTCPGLLNYLPTQLNTATNLPVLAFWRLDPLPDQLLTNVCGNAATAKAIADRTLPVGSPISNVPCVGRKMYTLVVYSINRDNARNVITNWNGRSRITRYTLPQYTDGSGTTATTGWYSPLARTFPNWPYDPNPLPGVPPLPTSPATNWAGNNQVLVDFIDDRTNDQGAAAAVATCPSVSSGGGATAIVPRPQDTKDGFYTTPAQGGVGAPGGLAGYAAVADISRRTFYACVRGGDAASLNQEVIVRIQGNAAGQPGVPIADGNVPVTMETRILTRGVLEKN
jgi:prepilin-type N-terminal cleavage/methylation domain-containing protein